MKREWMRYMAVISVALMQLGLTGVSPVRAVDEIGKSEPPALTSLEDKISYAIGVEMGRNLMRQKIQADPEIVARGIKNAMTGETLQLTSEEHLAVLNRFAGELRAKRGGERVLEGLDNKKEGEAFLAENKTRDGVVTLPSGLQYRILKPGSGPQPGANDIVECNYRGNLPDGTVFTDTSETGEAAVFKVSDSNVIPGLREALKLMPVGSIWQLFIPYTLAYGQRGFGRYIGPYATLVFELELLSIK